MIADVTIPASKKTSAAFIGLHAYSEEQADIFYGRDEEIKALYKLIKTHTITIVFGKSGTGKTSLLNAGVFPKLREDYCLPFRIRLDFSDNSPNLLTQVKNVLRTEIDKYGFKVETYPDDETLWEYFHYEPTWNIITPILIFDQFEEIFTLANKSSQFKKEELDVFLEELSDLIENTIPEKIKERIVNNHDTININFDRQKAKIIFAFREDFLPEIESITARIPSVKYSRFRLRAMTGNQALEVITKTWKDAIKPAEAKKIVYFLTNEAETDLDVKGRYGKNDIVQVEPSLLSQVCTYIDRQRIQQKQDTISAAFLSKYPKGIILRSIYNEVIEESTAFIKSNKSRAGSKSETIKEFIEDNLITDEGYRTKYALKDIDEDILPAVDLIKRKYLIREEGGSIELTHDVIVTLVKSDREERRKKSALLIAKKNAQRKFRLLILAVGVVGIAIWAGITYEAYKEKQRLKDQQKDILKENNLLISDQAALTKTVDSLKNKKAVLLIPKKNKLPDNINSDSNATKMKALLQGREELITGLNDKVNTLNSRYSQLTDSINFYKATIDAMNKQPRTPQADMETGWRKVVIDKQRELDNRKKEFDWKNNQLIQKIYSLERQRDSLLAKLPYNAEDAVSTPIRLSNIPKNDPYRTRKPYGYGFDYPDQSKPAKGKN